MGQEGDTGSPWGGSGETSPLPVCSLKEFSVFPQAQGPTCLGEAPHFPASQLSGPGLQPFLTPQWEKLSNNNNS